MKKLIVILSLCCLSPCMLLSQRPKLFDEVLTAMKNASVYMVDSVSENGGYLWHYTKDLSRRWGEMEAYRTMIWVQRPGTVSMGHIFLSAYETTHDEFYYNAAEKVANAMIWGQSSEGGWHYIIDFAGDKSLANWYNTIGKNGWRLEEFQHYYGNSTYDDDVTSDAARFILRMYLEKFDPKYKVPLDKAVNFIIKSQFDNGAWPQRYPLMFDYVKNGLPDYTSFYTFNDDVIGENVEFLIQCYETLGEKRFLEPIRKGMNFYLMSQHPSGGWAQQYDWNMRVAGARSYEPAALLPSTTSGNAFLCLKFYQYTGDKAYLAAAARAIQWLEMTELPKEQWDGSRTHPTFVEPETNRPVYVHRTGSNVVNGKYYWDYEDRDLLKHYGGKNNVRLKQLKDEYDKLSKLDSDEVILHSPIIPKIFVSSTTPQKSVDLNRFDLPEVMDENAIRSILKELDSNKRWLSKHEQTSNPYIGDPSLDKSAAMVSKYNTTFVGDKYDTSPFTDESDQEYISIRTFEKNMRTLIGYINYLVSAKLHYTR